MALNEDAANTHAIRHESYSGGTLVPALIETARAATAGQLVPPPLFSRNGARGAFQRILPRFDRNGFAAPWGVPL